MMIHNFLRPSTYCASLILEARLLQMHQFADGSYHIYGLCLDPYASCQAIMSNIGS